MQKLVLFQNRATRVIPDIPDKRHPFEDMFSKLKWMTHKERNDYRKSALVTNHKTVCTYDVSQICSHLCLAETQDQLLIMIYKYHRVGTKKCAGKVLDTVVS